MGKSREESDAERRALTSRAFEGATCTERVWKGLVFVDCKLGSHLYTIRMAQHDCKRVVKTFDMMNVGSRFKFGFSGCYVSALTDGDGQAIGFGWYGDDSNSDKKGAFAKHFPLVTNVLAISGGRSTYVLDQKNAETVAESVSASCKRFVQRLFDTTLAPAANAGSATWITSPRDFNDPKFELVTGLKKTHIHCTFGSREFPILVGSSQGERVVAAWEFLFSIGYDTYEFSHNAPVKFAHQFPNVQTEVVRIGDAGQGGSHVFTLNQAKAMGRTVYAPGPFPYAVLQDTVLPDARAIAVASLHHAGFITIPMQAMAVKELAMGLASSDPLLQPTRDCLTRAAEVQVDTEVSDGCLLGDRSGRAAYIFDTAHELPRMQCGFVQDDGSLCTSSYVRIYHLTRHMADAGHFEGPWDADNVRDSRFSFYAILRNKKTGILEHMLDRAERSVDGDITASPDDYHGVVVFIDRKYPRHPLVAAVAELHRLAVPPELKEAFYVLCKSVMAWIHLPLLFYSDTQNHNNHIHLSTLMAILDESVLSPPPVYHDHRRQMYLDQLAIGNAVAAFEETSGVWNANEMTASGAFRQTKFSAADTRRVGPDIPFRLASRCLPMKAAGRVILSNPPVTFDRPVAVVPQAEALDEQIRKVQRESLTLTEAHDIMAKCQQVTADSASFGLRERSVFPYAAGSFTNWQLNSQYRGCGSVPALQVPQEVLQVHDGQALAADDAQMLQPVAGIQPVQDEMEEGQRSRSPSVEYC